MTSSAPTPRSKAVPYVMVGFAAVVAGALAALLVPAKRVAATSAAATDPDLAARAQCTSQATGPALQRRPRGQLAPPTFITKPAGGIQTDPTAADYDALALSALVSGGLRNVFDSEPRDQAWAAP